MKSFKQISRLKIFHPLRTPADLSLMRVRFISRIEGKKKIKIEEIFIKMTFLSIHIQDRRKRGKKKSKSKKYSQRWYFYRFIFRIEERGKKKTKIEEIFLKMIFLSIMRRKKIKFEDKMHKDDIFICDSMNVRSSVSRYVD